MVQDPGSEAAFNLPRVGRMNQNSVDELTEHLRRDPVVREEAINRLRSNPRDFVEQVFDLSRAEEYALRSSASEERLNLVAQIYILVLKNPGVRLAFTRTDGMPEIRLELALRTMDVDQPSLVGDVRLLWFCLPARTA
jgi:hypothetical protein